MWRKTMKRLTAFIMIAALTLSLVSCKSADVTVELTSDNFFDFFQIAQTLNEEKDNPKTTSGQIFGTRWTETTYDRSITVLYTVGPKVSFTVDSPITVELSVGSSGDPEHWESQKVTVIIPVYDTKQGEVVFKDKYVTGTNIGIIDHPEFGEATFVIQSVTGHIQIENGLYQSLFKEEDNLTLE